MSRLGGGRSITDRVIFRQSNAPDVTDSVVWIDTSGPYPQTKIYDSTNKEWLAVAPTNTGEIAESIDETDGLVEIGDFEGTESLMEGGVPVTEPVTMSKTFSFSETAVSGIELQTSNHFYENDDYSYDTDYDYQVVFSHPTTGDVYRTASGTASLRGSSSYHEYVYDHLTFNFDLAYTGDVEIEYTVSNVDYLGDENPDLDFRPRDIEIQKSVLTPHTHTIPRGGE